jgi:hypothetical protein
MTQDDVSKRISAELIHSGINHSQDKEIVELYISAAYAAGFDYGRKAIEWERRYASIH